MSFLDSRTHAARQGIGQPVPRAEDRRLITGRGCYSDDVTLPRQAYAAFVRSPHAHAAIRRIDAHAALSVPGVLAVLTGTDTAELAGIPHRPVPTNPTKFRCAAATTRPSSSRPTLRCPPTACVTSASRSPW
jgi:carbon-monoxide dehydrogenase large subunit